MGLAVKDVELCSIERQPTLQQADHVILEEASEHHQRLELNLAQQFLSLHLVLFIGEELLSVLREKLSP
jgi:RNase P/RNase MRP subunit p30